MAIVFDATTRVSAMTIVFNATFNNIPASS